ncbi:MAG TPA: glycosyltransferase 87 family protein [Mycolicibacillus parakoreensis]|nr:glycosyltransferase 87 family protein [Mycolicibacillus parakoreensis]
MSRWRSPDGGMRRKRVAWRIFQVLTAVALAGASWWVLTHWPYRIDIDVYRMGGRAWLDGLPLYTDGVLFPTRSGLNLPFTYPPLAAIVFSPFAVMPLPVATAVITLVTLVLLIVSVTLVLTSLDVWPTTAVAPGPAWWRRAWLAAAVAAPTVIAFEPIRSNFSFGQINVVLMALVIADCLPRRTPWPRGLLLGFAIALKLTPAVFVLFFLLRRDGRAMAMTAVSLVGATLLAAVLARQDSLEYWTHTVRNTDRIGGATLNTNQNIAGALARMGLSAPDRTTVWLIGSVLVLVLTLVAARRALRAGQPALALVCIALFGLVVSPVSWSHHWVWALPAVVVTAVLGYRRRSALLGALVVSGAAIMVCPPMLVLLPENHEADAAWWRQLAGLSYVWWALALLVVTTVRPRHPAVAAPATESVPAGA